MEAPASKRQRSWLAFVPIALLIGLAYSNSLQGELFYDNRPTILEDARIRDVSGAGEIFGTTYWYGKRSTLYRPLTTTSYLVNYALLGSGPAPFTYHLVNLLLHVATAALLFALALRLLRSTFAAVLAAILFGLHPIATEAVSNVVGRADQLAAFGVLAGLLLHVRAATGGSRWSRLAAQLPYAIALFSKESGSVLLALALAADVLLLWPPGADPASRLRAFAAAEWRRLLPYAVTFALYLAARQMVVAGIQLGPVDYRDNPLVLATGIGRLAGVVKVFGLQLARLFFPWTLSGDYSYAQIPNVTTPLDPLLLTGLFGLISLVILALVFARRAPVATFGLTFFFIALMPVSNLLFLIGTILGERLLYLPLCGLALALAALLRLVPMPRKVALIATVLLALVFTARTWARNLDWQHEYDFWRATFAASPASVRARTMFAEKHADRFAATRSSALDESLALLEAGVTTMPREPMLLASLSWYSLSKVARLMSVKNHAEAKALLARVRGWVETALAVDAERVAAEERALAPGRLPTVSLDGHLETYRAHGALVASECLLAEAMQEKVDPARLRAAEESLRRGVLTFPSRSDVAVELMQNLLAQGRPEDAVVVGLWPLLRTGGQDRATEAVLAQAYRAAQIDPAAALVEQSGRLVPRSTAPAKAQELLARSVRVLARQLRAAGAPVQAARVVDVAVRRGVERARVASVLDEIPDARAPGFWEPWDGH